MLTPEQLEARKQGIGGSDAAAVCSLYVKIDSLSKEKIFQTPLEIYFEKLGISEPQIDNKHTKNGKLLEPIVAQIYEEETGETLITQEEFLGHKNGFKHPQYNWMLGNVDRIVKGKNIIVELKTAGWRTHDSWGIPGTDEIPIGYLLQCAHYAVVCDAERVDLAVKIEGDGLDFRIYRYERNPEIENRLIEFEKKFWHEHVLAQVPPAPQTLGDTAALWPVSQEKICQANDATVAAIHEINRVNKQIAGLKEYGENLKIEVQKLMQDANTLIDSNGNKLATWKTQKNNKRIFRLNNKMEVIQNDN